MSQTITVKIKLTPTKEQASILNEMSKTYISSINNLVSEMVRERKGTKKSSKDIPVNLPSAVKNQTIKDAKSIFKKVKKSNYEIVPVLNLKGAVTILYSLDGSLKSCKTKRVGSKV
jgi:hypothetical protein